MSCCFTSRCPEIRGFFLRIETGLQSAWDHRVVKDMRESIPGRVARAFFAITLIVLAIVAIAKLILLLSVIAPSVAKGGLIVAAFSAAIFGVALVITTLYLLIKKVVEAIRGCLTEAAENRQRAS